MLFWIAAAVLTASACLSVLSPFLRKREAGATRAEHELSVYRDQLDEVERDRARDLIQGAEAEQARAEIGRRILRLEDNEPSAPRGRSTSAAKAVAMAGVLAIPLLSWGVYGLLGSPDMPAQPLAARLGDPSGNSVANLIKQVEQRLATDPQDGRGWDVIAPIYLRTGRSPEAVAAYQNAIRLLGESGERQSALGEALVAQAGGQVSAEARTAFERALALQPADGRARFHLAVATFQDGRTDEARQKLTALRDEAEEESPWKQAAAQALAQLDTPPQPAPTGEDVANAEAMSGADRNAMIETMVASLDARLRANPGDAEGWQRLVRSYAVLGRMDEARDALARGMTALAPNAEATSSLREFAAAQGVTAEAAP